MKAFEGFQRFEQLTPHLYAQCCFVFTAEAAEKMAAISWPAEHIHSREPREGIDGKTLPATRKLYLAATKMSLFELTFHFESLVVQAEGLWIHESWVEWNFLRNEGEARIACMRISEKIPFGFGRPHPFKPHFKANRLFAGPLVDYRPGMKEGWKFEPVWMKVRPTQTIVEHYLCIEPSWHEHFVTLTAKVDVDVSPASAPAELVAYEFPLRRPSQKARFDNRVYRNIQHGGSR